MARTIRAGGGVRNWGIFLPWGMGWRVVFVGAGSCGPFFEFLFGADVLGVLL